MRQGDTTRYMTPKVPLRERARPTTSCRPGPLTRRASRSEAMMVVVDFSPRRGSIVVARRGAAVERNGSVCFRAENVLVLQD